MVKDALEDQHMSRGEDYLLQVIGMMKEKVSFTQDLLTSSQFFFDMPSTYDEKVQRKKWKGEVPQHMQSFAELLRTNASNTAEAMEQTLTDYCESAGIGKGMMMQPLRWAVSGQAGGPPLFDMLAIIGLEQVVQRIEYAVKEFPSQQG